MKILVAAKRVVDPYVRIRVNSDHSAVETQNVKMGMNPFDEIALEEALRLREKGIATEIVVVSIGSEAAQDILRHALALGADKAVLVRTQTQYESLNIAKILKKMVMREQPELVLMGKQAIDGDNNQTPQMLAALLDWPQATYASALTVDQGCLQVTREVDGGLETLKVHLPAVVSTDLRLNNPRYPNLSNIMKVRNKPIEQLELKDLDLQLTPYTEIVQVVPPKPRAAGIKVASVAELLNKLRSEAQVL